MVAYKNNWDHFEVYLGSLEEPIAALSILMINGFAYASKGYVGDQFDVNILNKLVQEAIPELEKRDCFLLRIDPEMPFDVSLNEELEELGFITRNRNLPIEQAHATIQPRFNFVKNLQGQTEEDLLYSFHSKTRYNIRLAQRKGVEVESGDTQELMTQFYNTYKIMSERHEITYRPKEYFERMVEAFGNTDHLRVYLAKFEDEVIAGSIAFEFGNKAWYMYGGSTNEKRNLMAPYLLQWEMMTHALKNNKEIYDFGGIFGFDNTDGLYKFKNGFFPKDEKEYYREYIGEIDWVLDDVRYKAFTDK